MATTPASTATPTKEFQPAFEGVQQSNDFDDAFACIAMIAGKTLDEVRQTAIDKFKHPRHGPFWIADTLITNLLAHYGWVATIYKENTGGIASLPELAIGMVEYNPVTEIGRHVLFHRMSAAGNPRQATEYIIDPAYWIEPDKHFRTDIKGFPIAWYIGVHKMKKIAAKGSQ